jgi:eukaryotic-like serine/threonine-protein kinase
VLLSGLMLGLAAGALDGLRLNIRPYEKGMRPSRHTRISTVVYVPAFVALGLIYGLILAVFEDSGDRAADAVFSGVFIGFVFGLIFGVRRTSRTLTQDIQTVEVINWSWKAALSRGAWSLAIFVGILGIPMLLHYLYAWHLGTLALQFRFDFLDWRSTLLALGAIGFLYVAMITVPASLFAGMKHGMLDIKRFSNQGIKLSIRKAIRACSLIGISVCLFGVAGGWLFDKLLVGSPLATSGGAIGAPMPWLFLAFLFGSIAGLGYGGLDVIQHYTLRVVMRFEGYIPSQFVLFLEHAVGLVFMQRAGGGFIFVHRSLLEHFAHLRSKWPVDAHQHEIA